VTSTSRQTLAVLLLALAFAAAIDVSLWRTTVPISEAVALFEDVQRTPPSGFIRPQSAYYRPFYHWSVGAIWRRATTIDARLAGIKLLQIVPVTLLVLAFAWRVRPRSTLQAVAAGIAITVLVGSPGFRDNLEIPLSYTTVGMPLVLLAWLIAERQRRWWSGIALIALAIVAVGFKEQGLVMVGIVLAAWWTRMPGASGWAAVPLALAIIPYIAFRVAFREHYAPFEQSIGIGFREVEVAEATTRFGAFPYPIYVLNALATICNVLFAEPTRGLFRITEHVFRLHPQPLEMVHVISSTLLTVVIAWWGLTAMRGGRWRTWSPEARLFIVFVVALLWSGALSFNYSRDRLGGMAVPLYALAAFFALEAALSRLQRVGGRAFTAGALILALIAGGWSIRAVGTLDWVWLTSWRNYRDWQTDLPKRRVEFADRPVYLEIMESMAAQGQTPPALPRGGRLSD
jgi:hypothetical protein